METSDLHVMMREVLPVPYLSTMVVTRAWPCFVFTAGHNLRIVQILPSGSRPQALMAGLAVIQELN